MPQYTNLDDAYASYRMLVADGTVDPADALASIQAECDDDTADQLAAVLA